MKITAKKGRKRKTKAKAVGCPKENRSETERVWGAQTFMRISESSLVTVQPGMGSVLELIVSPGNMNEAYRQVKRNGGAGGVDRMGVEVLLPYQRVHCEELTKSVMDGSYRPNPVLRVEIPKDKGEKRPLGIPTVVDRVVQQAISQVLIYPSTPPRSAVAVSASALAEAHTMHCARCGST